jgi:hypothetical protein
LKGFNGQAARKGFLLLFFLILDQLAFLLFALLDTYSLLGYN